MVLQQLNVISVYFKNKNITYIQDKYKYIKDAYNDIILLYVPKINQSSTIN